MFLTYILLPIFAVGYNRPKDDSISNIVHNGSVLPRELVKKAVNIVVYSKKAVFHSPLTIKPQIRTANGSAIIPNIQRSVGLKILAITLPIKAAEKPAYGPNKMASIGSR